MYLYAIYLSYFLKIYEILSGIYLESRINPIKIKKNLNCSNFENNYSQSVGEKSLESRNLLLKNACYCIRYDFQFASLSFKEKNNFFIVYCVPRDFLFGFFAYIWSILNNKIYVTNVG